MGIKGILSAGHVELGARHDGGHRGVHLHHRFQLLAGEVTGYQGIAGLSVLSHAHGQYVKGLGGGNIPLVERGPQHPVGHHRHRLHIGGVFHQCGGGPVVGIGHQVSKGVIHPVLVLGLGQVVVAGGEHLVVAQAIRGKIAGADLIFPSLHQGGDGLVLRYCLINGCQVIIL